MRNEEGENKATSLKMAASQRLNREWCPLAFASSSSSDPVQGRGDAALQTCWKYKYADGGRKVSKLFTFLLSFSVLPLSILVTEVSTGSHLSIDSNRAIHIDLVESPSPLPEGSYLHKTAHHKYYSCPKWSCHFFPSASHWINFIAHSFMWPYNNSLSCLHISQSTPL